MTRKALKSKKWAVAKSDRRRRVFTCTCSCDSPRISLAVNFGSFCLNCWHPVAPKVQGKRRKVS